MQTTASSTADTDRKLLAGERLTPAEIAHIHQLDAVAQCAIKAKAGRAAGARKRNPEQAQPIRDGIVKAAALVPLYQIRPCHRARAVWKIIMKFGPERFGLSAIPCDRVIRCVLAEIIQ